MTHETTTVAQTEAIAADLAASLQPGDVVALEGDLGAGKTQFVRGLLRGLGGDPRLVSSPTYVLLNVYPGGRLTLYHVDAYRTAGPDDLAGVGFDEVLDAGGVVAVEWPSRVTELLPARRYTVTLTAIGDGVRTIEVVPPNDLSTGATG